MCSNQAMRLYLRDRSTSNYLLKCVPAGPNVSIAFSLKNHQQIRDDVENLFDELCSEIFEKTFEADSTWDKLELVNVSNTPMKVYSVLMT